MKILLYETGFSTEELSFYTRYIGKIILLLLIYIYDYDVRTVYFVQFIIQTE
jgi:hypothetical protein